MTCKTPFPSNQITWVIFKYVELRSVSKVIRSYGVEFHLKNRREMPLRTAFFNAIERFKKSGGNAKQKQREGKGISEDHVKQVEDYCNTNE